MASVVEERAGKTTTVECIEGLRPPDRGQIGVLGLDPGRDHGELRQRMGVRLQDSELPEQVRVGERFGCLVCDCEAGSRQMTGRRIHQKQKPPTTMDRLRKIASSYHCMGQ
jgi:ABC-type multidrug transport system ATPase subunit